MRVAFWNTNNNKIIDEYIVDLVNEYKIDIICLAEYSGKAEKVYSKINIGKNYSLIDAPGCERVTIISNISEFEPAYQSKYCTIQIIENKMIFCVAHLPSRIHSDIEKRRLVVFDIVRQINELEIKINISKTIIVGDLNDNPYEYTCLGADTFHGIPIENDARRIKRTIYGSEYKMFYNPMWNLLGEKNYPPGTYYYVSNDAMCSYWNMYDQVMIRPALIDSFDKSKLKILYEIKNRSLIDSAGHPDVQISDHLPIIFEIGE